MERTHDGSHGDDCFGCRIQSIQFDSRAMPTRRNDARPPGVAPSWEKGRVGETRADGSFMPYLTGDHKPLGVKQWQDQRSKREPIRRHQLNTTTPLT